MISFASLVVLLPFSLTVCSEDCPFTTIREAVSNVAAGTEVRIGPGNYREELPLTIVKPLRLVGAEGAMLHGDGKHDVILVTADDVVVENLSIRDGGSSYIHEIAAIRVEGAARCSIRNNRLENNAYGVYLADATECVVSGNRIRGEATTESESGNGIHSWSGSRHRIEGNTVERHRDGIYIEFTSDSAISRNRTSENLRYGLHFMSAHRNVYSENRFENNGAGVAVMYSRNIGMSRNTFARNSGAAAYGLLLKDISNGDIRENTFIDNTIGVYMEGTNRSRVIGNQFVRNGYAARVLADCEDNSIEGNNFLGNTFDVATNSNRNPNRFERNFWSNYGGYDLDFDGVGDVPDRPVSLSSILVEKFDSTYLLLKSPLFFALDQVEQAFPTLIPEALSDARPLMAPLPLPQ